MEKSLDFQALFGSPFRDNYGRCYPYKVFLRNGDMFIGLYTGSSMNGEIFERISFKLIEDLNEWVYNRDYIGSKMINLKPKEISEMVAFDESSINENEL